MYRTEASSANTTAAPAASGGASAALRPEGSRGVSSWYGKLASAWGVALDRQADRTVALAQQLRAGTDGPGQAIEVSAAAQQLTFLCSTAANVSTSIGQALETLGRKQ
jgi:hypothetical protein